MRAVMLILVGLFLSLGTAAAQEPKTVAPDKCGQTLKHSQRALKELITSLFKAEFKATGSLAAKIPSVEGRAILGRRTEDGVPRFRAETTLHPPDSDDSLEYTIGTDGETYFAIDRKTRVVYVNPNKEVLGTYGKDLMRMLMSVYSDPDPFASELKGKCTHLGEETVADQACHKVRIEGKNTPDVIWYISKEDWLPRKRVEVFSKNGVTTGTTELTITFFIPNPRWGAKDMFQAPTDPSYSRTTVLAP